MYDIESDKIERTVDKVELERSEMFKFCAFLRAPDTALKDRVDFTVHMGPVAFSSKLIVLMSSVRVTWQS